MSQEKNSQHKQHYGKEKVNPFEGDNKNIFNKDNDGNKYHKFLLEDLDVLVQSKLKSISKTQMRNIFDLIKNCQTVEEMNMIKPKLMYTAGRLTGVGRDYLLNLSKVVIEVKNETDLNYVKKYIETVLAYHKFYAVK